MFSGSRRQAKPVYTVWDLELCSVYVNRRASFGSAQRTVEQDILDIVTRPTAESLGDGGWRIEYG